MKTGRPLGFNPDEALQSATTLFWEKGFEGSSTNELMKVMKLSKSSLYQTFGSKQELFNKCINHYGATTMKQINQTFDESKSPKAFIEMIFKSIVVGIVYIITKGVSQNGMPAGCFIINSICELSEGPSEVGKLLTSKTKEFRELLHKAVTSGMEAGEISKDKNSKSISAFLFTNLCGLRVMENLDVNKEDMDSTVEQIMSVLD